MIFWGAVAFAVEDAGALVIPGWARSGMGAKTSENRSGISGAFENKAGLPLVNVAVGVSVLVSFVGFEQGRTGVRDVADSIFELHGGVLDVEFFAEQIANVVEDDAAFRRRDIGNGDVHGERAAVGAEAPDVKIVHVDDAFDV